MGTVLQKGPLLKTILHATSPSEAPLNLSIFSSCVYVGNLPLVLIS